MKRTRLKPQSDNKRQWRYKYHADQSRRRNEMVRTYGHTYCERCGEPGAVEGHHPDGQNGPLIMHYFLLGTRYACACHDFIHSQNPNAAREEGWLRAKNAKPNTRTMPKSIAKPEPTAELANSLLAELAEDFKNTDKTLESIGRKFLRFQDEQLWQFVKKPKGGFCRSFDEFTFVMSEMYGSRSTIYRLMTQAKVSENIGTEVPLLQAAALSVLPAGEQADALDKAKRIAENSRGPNAAPTTADVEKAVEDKKSTPTPPAPPAPPDNSKQANTKPAPDPWKSEPVRLAMARLGKLLGPEVRAAIEKHSLEIKPDDVVHWAKQSDDDVRAIDPLVVGVRWSVRKALAFIKEMPDCNSKASVFMNLALAHGGQYEATIDGFTFTIKAPKRKGK